MFEATARLKIGDGQLEGFKHQVDEIMRLTRESESQPLRYDQAWTPTSRFLRRYRHERYVLSRHL